MKEGKLRMNRDKWELIREFRKAPIRKKYLEFLKKEQGKYNRVLN